MNPASHPASLEKIALSAEGIARFLERAPWTRDLSWNQLLILGQHFKAFKAAMGTVIFTEGSTDRSMGVIAEGTLDIQKADHHHKLQVITTLTAGKTIGEMSLVDGEPRSARVVAASDSILLIITHDEFDAFARQTPLLAVTLLKKIAAILSQRLRKTSGALVEFLGDDQPQE